MASEQITLVNEWGDTSREEVIISTLAAGNEPFLLAAAVATEINKLRARLGLRPVRIVLPLFDQKQVKVLLDEDPSYANTVEVDWELGAILKETVATQGDYRRHMSYLVGNHDGVSQAVQARFQRDNGLFKTRPLTNGDEKIYKANQVNLALNVGARIGVESVQQYFMFSGLLSDIIEEAFKKDIDFGTSEMKSVLLKMRELEKFYSLAFISKLNAPGFQYLPDNGSLTMLERYVALDAQPHETNGVKKVYTPAMKRVVVPSTHPLVTRDGVYIMFSGTGSGIEQTKRLVAIVQSAGLVAYIPEWIGQIPGAVNISPTVLSNNHIKAIFGRAGWGTGWQAQNLGKPWFVNPWETTDDPEILLNTLLVERMGIGEIVSMSDLTGDALKKSIAKIAPDLRILNQCIEREFGTRDGVRYMAEKIMSDRYKGEF